jgi:hypothetical protein
LPPLQGLDHLCRTGATIYEVAQDYDAGTGGCAALVIIIDAPKEVHEQVEFTVNIADRINAMAFFHLSGDLLAPGPGEYAVHAVWYSGASLAANEGREILCSHRSRDGLAI